MNLHPTIGMAETALGVTGSETPGPLATLRLIAANQSTDPLLANVERAVRDALARIDATALPTNPLADRFTIERYSGGEVDVHGERVVVGTMDHAGDEVLITADTDIGSRDLRVIRATAMEIRDTLDVLFSLTRRNTL